MGVAAFVGWQCSAILLPLLQQGLSDPEEFVIARCINTMASLTSLQLLQKVALYELLKETTAYLVHPNLWIRQATASFVSATAQILDGVDVVVKLGAILKPFMKHPVVQMDQAVLILANVESPIPRIILDGVVKTQPEILSEFLNILEERQTARRSMAKVNSSQIQVLYAEIPQHVKPLFRRLASDGMTSTVEDKLLFMKENLVKISKHRCLSRQENPGSIELLDLGQLVRIPRKAVHLDYDDKKVSVATEATPDDDIAKVR